MQIYEKRSWTICIIVYMYRRPQFHLFVCWVKCILFLCFFFVLLVILFHFIFDVVIVDLLYAHLSWLLNETKMIYILIMMYALVDIVHHMHNERRRTPQNFSLKQQHLTSNNKIIFFNRKTTLHQILKHED